MVYDDTSALDVLQSKLDVQLDKEGLFKEFKQRKIELIDAQPLRSGVLEYCRQRAKAFKNRLGFQRQKEWIDRYITKHQIDHYFRLH